MIFLGVHGEEFLDLVEDSWNPNLLNNTLWYLLLMPIWCAVAHAGVKGLQVHYAKKEAMTPADPLSIRLGRVKHKREVILMHKQRRSRDSALSEALDAETSLLDNVNAGTSQTSEELGLITTTIQNSKEDYGAIQGELQDMHTAVDFVEGEDDPQDEEQTMCDFLVAIGFVLFGVTAFTAGVYSIMQHG